MLESLISSLSERIPERLRLNVMPLQEKAFVLICLCSGGLAGASVLVNGLLGLPISLNLLLTLCLAGCLWLLADWYRHRKSRAMSLMLLDLITVGAVWFPNGGLHSSIPLYFLALVILAALVLPMRSLLLLIALAMSELGLLTALELLHPEWLTPYASSYQAIVDLLASIFVISISLGLSVNVLVRAYHRERTRAEEASRAKSIFLSQMSHELRTPLNAVIGFSGQLLEKGESLDAARHRLYLKRVRANGEHLLALVNQILDLSRIEAGHLELFWQETDLGRLVAEVTELMELLAREKGLRLRLELPERLPSLRTDPARLRQILLNLIGNAVKYTHQGGVVCRIHHLPEGLRVEIQDSGPGIPEAERELIFEPFVRLPGSEGIQGSGMGLPITRFLCAKMGYGLELLDAPGGGSLFVLMLPFEPVPEPEPQPERVPSV